MRHGERPDFLKHVWFVVSSLSIQIKQKRLVLENWMPVSMRDREGPDFQGQLSRNGWFFENSRPVLMRDREGPDFLKRVCSQALEAQTSRNGWFLRI